MAEPAAARESETAPEDETATAHEAGRPAIGDGRVRKFRRRDAVKTRGDILDAATHRFARYAYARVTLKDVAEDAGVTPALVVRYFGSKRGLFEEVVSGRISLDPLETDDLAGQTSARARAILDFFEDRTARAPALALLRSFDLDDDGALFRAEFERKVLTPWSSEISGRDADIRVSLIAGLLFGVGAFSLGALTEPDRAPLQPADAERTTHYLAAMLAVCMQDPDASDDAHPSAT